jgi:AcrR family transcriptional regulator
VTAIEQTEARPRGTRLPRRARRNQLLGAAQEVFVAQGYHAAAMDDIADRAGVSKPVLYQHFPGKLDLYLALLDQHCESLLQAVRAALASTTDNKQRVAATMDAYFAYVEDEGGAFRLVFESDLTNEPAVRDRVDGALLARFGPSHSARRRRQADLLSFLAGHRRFPDAVTCGEHAAADPPRVRCGRAEPGTGGGSGAANVCSVQRG